MKAIKWLVIIPSIPLIILEAITGIVPDVLMSVVFAGLMTAWLAPYEQK